MEFLIGLLFIISVGGILHTLDELKYKVLYTIGNLAVTVFGSYAFGKAILELING